MCCELVLYATKLWWKLDENILFLIFLFTQMFHVDIVNTSRVLQIVYPYALLNVCRKILQFIILRIYQAKSCGPKIKASGERANVDITIFNAI